MKTIKNKFPKKCKLITDGGFYKIVTGIPFGAQRIKIPLLKRISIATPETGITDMSMTFEVEFIFYRVYRGYAEYLQSGVVNIIK